MAQKSRIFRLFVSSTFSDMIMEQNVLHEHVYPRLKELCATYGACFQAIDLCWRISQEVGLNQGAI
jgi:hypothetical protein